MSTIKNVNEKTFAEEVLHSQVPVLVDFWAPWCGPCRFLSPIVEELAGEYAGRFAFVKLNVDENPNLQMKHEVFGIPTLILFRDGQPIEKLVGLRPKQELKRHLDKALAV